ncbi:hypothetical protein ACFE04_003130 [Oxalis oulophora]
MEYGFGVPLVKHGGVLLFKGVSNELILDSDKVSYQEVKGFLNDKGYVEANLRIYFITEGRLKILHSDQSSIEFGNCICNDGEVSVFVAHEEGINIDHISYNGGEDNSNAKDQNAEDLIGTANIDQSRCSARQTDEVLQASWDNLEDVELDDLHAGYEYRVDLNDNGSSESDETYEDFEGQSEDSDDDELYCSRENLRKASIDAKSRCENLSSVMKNLEKDELNREKLKGKCVEDPNNELGNDVGSEDSYDIESDGERGFIEGGGAGCSLLSECWIGLILIIQMCYQLPPPDWDMPGRPPRNRVRDEFEKGGNRMSRKGGTKTCNICNLIGHNKLSCPDRPNPTEKPPRKPRTKKKTDEGTSSAPTNQPLRQHRKMNPTTDVIDTTVDVGTSSQPVTLDIPAIVDEMVVQNKEVHRVAEAVLEEVNIKFVELIRRLIEKDKNPPDLGFNGKVVIIDKSMGKKIFNSGTKSQFEILSNPNSTTTTQWHDDLAPLPLPKGHTQFKST